jgi:hypothetical protein
VAVSLGGAAPLGSVRRADADGREALVVDVFSAAAGEPDDATSGAHPDLGVPGANAVDPSRLEPVLEGARLWGAELDTRYRVLALTVEPAADRYPWGDDAADRRIQVLCHPVSTILISLVRHTDEGRALLEFSEEQLVDVVAALDGPTLEPPLFGRAEPRPGEWGPRFSLQGRSTAGDGTRTTLCVRPRTEELSFDLFARVDHLEVRDPEGGALTLG